MKKRIVIIQVVLLMLLIGCKDSLVNNMNVGDVAKQSEWEYDNKLAELREDENLGKNIGFLIKDLDNDSISELIIKEEMELTVYTYAKGIVELGNYDFATATTQFMVSEDEKYPGIFYFNTSGGLEHCGYISVKDKALKVEELWNKDYSGIAELLGIERDEIEYISKDEQLVNESNKVHSRNKELVFEELIRYGNGNVDCSNVECCSSNVVSFCS